MSYRQEDQNKREHDYVLSCTYGAGVFGGRCQHWSEETKKDSVVVIDQKNELDCAKTETCNFVEIQARSFVIYCKAS